MRSDLVALGLGAAVPAMRRNLTGAVRAMRGCYAYWATAGHCPRSVSLHGRHICHHVKGHDGECECRCGAVPDRTIGFEEAPDRTIRHEEKS